MQLRNTDTSAGRHALHYDNRESRSFFKTVSDSGPAGLLDHGESTTNHLIRQTIKSWNMRPLFDGNGELVLAVRTCH